jgi:MoaA/NifB/PqqE/SkfB family radical SAM enzyme
MGHRRVHEGALRMFEIIPKIFLYKLYRKFGYPKIFPINFTVSVTYRCNSRCRTCNVWKKKTNEFTLKEFEKTFKNIGRTPYWITMSGGEPFLRSDIVEICQCAHDNCNPKIINIPTNGILYNIIPKRVEEIVESCSKSQIVINLSLDGVGEKHDGIRNVKNNFKSAMRTYTSLRALEYRNLNLGIHTVISKFNVNNIPELYKYVQKLNPDSYITEIAEERVELDTIGANITPSFEEYSKAVDFLSSKIKNENFTGISKVTQAFRLEYYNIVKKVLKDKRQVIPCYAGFASAQIAPNGDVWTCCIRAEPIGNLRENNYDFGKVWFSENADQLRSSIKAGECYCPLANASYTSMLCNFRSSMKVLKNLANLKLGKSEST